MSKTGADRPTTDEIEITPKMIEAGRYELALYNRDFEDPAEAVSRIFLAMREVEFQK